MANIQNFLNGAIQTPAQTMTPSASPLMNNNNSMALQFSAPNVNEELLKRKQKRLPEQTTSESYKNPYEDMSNEQKKALTEERQASGETFGDSVRKAQEKLSNGNFIERLSGKLLFGNKPMQNMIKLSDKANEIGNKMQRAEATRPIEQARKSALKEMKAEEKRQAKETKSASDERLKKLFCNNEDIVSLFARINAIDFKYTPEAQNEYNGAYGVDNDEHIGIKAQELEQNPVTASTVMENENGHKIVDTKELTFANSAVLSEVCKRIEIIEKILGIEVK